jgi:hypothetical protein
MGQFLGGLFCMVVGIMISLIAIGISASVTLGTASFWYWLPAIIGVVLGLLVWTGGDLDFCCLFD